MAMVLRHSIGMFERLSDAPGDSLPNHEKVDYTAVTLLRTQDYIVCNFGVIGYALSVPMNL